MYITRFRALNYKSFKDSGFVELEQGFNVFIGQNNSGKTALLETLRLHNCPAHPHKDKERPVSYPLDPRSVVEFDIRIGGQEMTDNINRYQNQVSIPVIEYGMEETFNRIFSKEGVDYRLKCIFGDMQYYSRAHPTIALAPIEPISSFTVGVDAGGTQVKIFGGPHNGGADDLPALIYWNFSSRIYVFKAERMNFANYAAADESLLRPDATNLPAVLAHFAARNPSKWEMYNRHVTSIISNVKRVTAPNVGGNYKIGVWNNYDGEERPDLINYLEDCGSGVGQVLSILYVVMTMPPSVIVIDEPSSFLHPGAVKKLLQVLKKYPHQYIISTHAPDLASAIDPETIHLVSWDEGQSSIKRLDRNQVQDMRQILSEVGVGLVDVFAADRVIWVEGPTEQQCFPKLYKQIKGREVPLGLSFLGVINTGDFEAKDWTARRIWELYKRLGEANGILPVAVAFCLDQESRTPKEMRDMDRQTGGMMRFLPRRTYENYLMHPSALEAVINSEIDDADSLTVGTVKKWIATNGSKYHTRGAQPFGDKFNEWIVECDAASLLADMTQDITNAKLEYRKTRHSVAVTEWILQNDPEFLSELCAYVVGLVPEDNDSPNGGNVAA